jgi:hypothetical protein
VIDRTFASLHGRAGPDQRAVAPAPGELDRQDALVSQYAAIKRAASIGSGRHRHECAPTDRPETDKRRAGGSLHADYWRQCGRGTRGPAAPRRRRRANCPWPRSAPAGDIEEDGGIQQVRFEGDGGDNLGRTQQYARLFMVPGMYHCSGGPGPNVFDALKDGRAGDLSLTSEIRAGPGLLRRRLRHMLH